MTAVTVEQLRDKVDLVQSLTNIDLRVSSSQLSLDQLYLSNQPAFIAHEGRRLLGELEQMPQQREVRLLVGWFDSYYLGVHWQGIAYLFGPFCIEKYDQGVNYSQSLSYLSLDMESRFLLESYLDQRAIFEPKKMEQIGKMVGSYLTTAEIDVQSYVKPANSPIKPAGSVQQELSKFASDDMIELRHRVEKRLLKAITLGDKQVYQQITKEYANKIRMPTRVKSSLQDSKYLAVTSNSISARAAIAGGVSVQVVDALSMRHIREIESCDSHDEIEKLWHTIPLNFCQLVNWYSTRRYSGLIRSAIELIRTQLQTTPGLTLLAEQLHVSPEHLARQFKRETKQTVAQYTNRLKIQESLPFIVDRQHSIDEIAEQLGFCSAAYFRKVFKDVMGTTPAQYAKNQRTINL
ncbi:helix-turn-helix domain-containing protein [Vibrio sp. WXL103]|uniref:helix-turn-helix domain-containing protein n=1 Tax=Vibrio sp. WXL103 TaxID=3450710 RepID=UPI003EC82D89